MSINGHQKTKETSKLKKIVNFKKGIGIERYTQFTTVTLIYEKIPKQEAGKFVTYMRLQVKIELKSYYILDNKKNFQFYIKGKGIKREKYANKLEIKKVWKQVKDGAL